MSQKRGLFIACLLIEVVASAHTFYLAFFTHALIPVPNLRQLDLVLMWLIPAGVILWGYADLVGGLVKSGRNKLVWGAVIAAFGCILLLALGRGFMPLVRYEIVRAAPVHVLLPLVVYWLTRHQTEGLVKSGETSSAQVLGQGAAKIALSLGIMAIGVWASFMLLQSGAFSHSLIFIGFVPIPGVVISFAPIVVALVVVLGIWNRTW